MRNWQNDGGAPEKLQAIVRAQMGISEPLRPLEVADFERKEPLDDQEWYVLVQGKPELKTKEEMMILLKSMGGDTLIALKGSSEWQKAKQVFSEFAEEEGPKVVKEESPEVQLLETYPTKDLIEMALAAQVITVDPGENVDREDLIARLVQAGAVPS